MGRGEPLDIHDIVVPVESYSSRVGDNLRSAYVILELCSFHLR